jgi:hypothetical protein
VFDSLKGGAQLFLDTASDTKVFRLHETSRALDRLRGCVDGYVRRPDPQTAGRAPAAGTPETNPFAPRPSDFAATFADYGRWQATAGLLSGQLFQLIDSLSGLDRVAERRLAGEIDDTDARTSARAILTRFRNDFGRASDALDRAPAYDGAYVPGRQLSRTVLRHLATVRDQLAAMAIEAEQSFNAAISHDKHAHARAQLRRLDRAIVLLKLENVAAELGNLSIEASHPQHSLLVSIITGNEAMIEILAHMKELSAGEPDGSRASAAAAIVSRMTAAIADGRAKVDPARRGLRQAQDATKEQLRVLDAAFDTYADSFLVEERISRVLLLTLKALPDTHVQATAFGADTKALFDRSNAALAELVSQRLALQQQRAELIAGIR